MPYSWIAIAVLTVLLAVAGGAIKHEIGQNAKLSEASETAQRELALEKASQKVVSQIDTDIQVKNDAINTDIQTLAAATAARTVILRVPAKCMQPTSATPSQPDEQRPELDPSVRSDYLSLRAGIQHAEAKIDGLKDYINKVCLKL